MAQFFLSQKAIEDIFQNEDAMHKILQKQGVIYVDIKDEELNEILFSDSSDEYPDNAISSYNRDECQILSCHSIVEDAKNGNYKALRIYDSPVLILDVNKNEASKISSSNGIICISDQERYDSLLQDHKSVYLEKPATKDDTREGYKALDEKSRHHTWTDILTRIKSLPCNAVIVNDHYLFKDDHVSDDHNYVDNEELRNVKQIFDAILPNKLEDNVMHVLFLHNVVDAEGKGDTADWKHTADRVKKAITRLRDYSMTFEFVSGNHNCHLFSETHNRNIVTNYMILSAEHKLAAFNSKGEPNADQKVSWYMLYGDGIENDSDLPERGKRLFVNRVKNIIKYGIDHPTSGYNFSQNGISNPSKISIKNIKNRLINLPTTK